MNGEQRYRQAMTKARILSSRNLRQFLADKIDWLPMAKDREFIVLEFDRLHDEIERMRERVAEMQYEAGMYKSLYENAGKVLGEINQIVRVPTKATGFRSADSHYQSDFDAIRKMTAPFSSEVKD